MLVLIKIKKIYKKRRTKENVTLLIWFNYDFLELFIKQNLHNIINTYGHFPLGPDSTSSHALARREKVKGL